MANGLPKRWEMEARVIINSTKHTDVALISISRRPLLSLDNSNALLNPEDHTGYITSPTNKSLIPAQDTSLVRVSVCVSQ